MPHGGGGLHVFIIIILHDLLYHLRSFKCWLSFSFWAGVGSDYEGLFTVSSERAQNILQISSISTGNTDLIWKRVDKAPVSESHQKLTFR